MMPLRLLLLIACGLACAHAKDVSVFVLVGTAIDLAHINLLSDMKDEVAGKQKPIFTREAIAKCTFDERRGNGQTTTIHTTTSRDMKDFVDNLSVSGSISLDTGGGISGTISGKYDAINEKFEEAIVIERKYMTIKGKVELNTECLSDEKLYSPSFLAVLRSLCPGELPEFYYESDYHKWKAYMDFFNAYGTHMITGAQYGYEFITLITMKETREIQGMEASGHIEAKMDTGGANSLDATGNGYKSDKEEKSSKSLSIDMIIKGGGMAESAKLQITATALFSQPDNAQAASESDEKSMSGQAVNDFNDAVEQWTVSCANDDTARAMSAHFIAWDALFRSNSIATHGSIIANMDRAKRIHMMLPLRKHCPMGSWDERAFQCDMNHHDLTALNRVRFIKSSFTGQYARYNQDAKTIEMVDEVQRASKFMFTRKGNPIEYHTRYGLKVLLDEGMASLFTIDCAGMFGASMTNGGIKGSYQFTITSKGLIALVPSKTSRAGDDFRYPTFFMKQDNGRLVLKKLPHEPSTQDRTREDELNYMFLFEDATQILTNDGRGGTTYQGGQHAGKWNGFGKLVWGQDNWYDGEWVLGEMHGHGVIRVGDMEYSGGFNHNLPHGVGQIICVNNLADFVGGKIRYYTRIFDVNLSDGEITSGKKREYYKDAGGPPRTKPEDVKRGAGTELCN